MQNLKNRLTILFALMVLPMLAFAQDGEVGLDEKIDQAFKPVSDFFSNVIFFEILPDTPLVIVLLVLMALFFYNLFWISKYQIF